MYICVDIPLCAYKYMCIQTNLTKWLPGVKPYIRDLALL